MSNQSKRIGTEGENRVLEWLRAIWGPGLRRSDAGRPGWDISPTPVAVESKRHKVWKIPAWSRYLTRLHKDRWVLFVLTRDRRPKDAPPDVMVVPVAFGVELLNARWPEWWIPQAEESDGDRSETGQG